MPIIDFQRRYILFPLQFGLLSQVKLLHWDGIKFEIYEAIALTDNQADDRIIQETGLEANIAAIIIPVLRDLGYHLVRVKMSGAQGCTVQIMFERLDGQCTIDDCEQASRAISPVLDVEDPIQSAYHLEISSPGIDRPLVRRSDFEQWLGFDVKIDLKMSLHGKRKFRGVLQNAGSDDFALKVTTDQGEETALLFPYKHIQDARLILTDALIDAAEKKMKPNHAH